MKRILTIAWLAALIGCLPVYAAYTPSSVPDPKTQGQGYYVANPDSILADSTVQWLNQCAAMLDEKTHVEMAIVALSAIEETTDAFDFAYELFQRWGIGREGQNTGVLILFVLDTHDLRIMTGTGIEGVLTDAKCSQIMHDEMFPAFRDGDYDGGLCLGALAIYETCTNSEAPEELLSVRSVTNRGAYTSEDEVEWTTGEIIALCFIGLGVLLIPVAIYFSPVKKSPESGKRKARARSYSSGGGGSYSEDSSSSSSGSWGGGSTSGGGAGGKW